MHCAKSNSETEAKLVEVSNYFNFKLSHCHRIFAMGFYISFYILFHAFTLHSLSIRMQYWDDAEKKNQSCHDMPPSQLLTLVCRTPDGKDAIIGISKNLSRSAVGFCRSSRALCSANTALQTALHTAPHTGLTDAGSLLFTLAI